MTLSFLVTLRSLSLGAQDTVTGWYAHTFTETASYDKMVILPKGYSLASFGVGGYAKYTVTGLICAPVFEDDEIIANSRYYHVVSVEPVVIGDSHLWYQCELKEAKMHGDQPSTSGTWHLDSDSVRTDPRYRMKVWLDGNLTAANIKEDDAATLATYITQFDHSNYNLKRIFITKGVDVVFSVGKVSSKPREDYLHKIYAHEETVPITIAAINKVGLTATNVVEQAEQEIRDVLVDYVYGATSRQTAGALGTVRSIESEKHDPVDLGESLMWSTTITVKYVRAEDEYVPTTPAFANDIAFTYEGDRLSGGQEGTWGEHEDGNTASMSVNSENNLELIVTASAGNKIYFVHNGTDLAYNSTTYTKIRGRYKTSNATIKAKVVLEFSTWADGDSEAVNIAAGKGQEVLAEASSLTWNVFSATITTGKIVANVRLYANGEKTDATATVTYDFVQIYAGDYILPNVTSMDAPFQLVDASISIPGRSGTLVQALGSQSMEIRMVCDLDMEHSDLTWKRAQTGTKTDLDRLQVFLELVFLGGTDADYPFTWLDVGDPPIQLKSRLVQIEPNFMGESGKLMLLWREYRHGTAANESTIERFGLSL